jgi:MucR family transcriptional regulator, transcriptional regulator of exopolysaccharide biosynthesis
MVERADDPEEDQQKPASLARLTTDIVAAYVAHNQVTPADLGTLIGAVANRLRELSRPQEPEPAKLEAAVPVRRSLTPDQLVCLVCGKRQRMLKRHLAGAHSLTPGQYREAFGLKSHYPMTAPSYSRQRSELAKHHGLGRPRKEPPRRRRRTAGARAQPNGGSGIN